MNLKEWQTSAFQINEQIYKFKNNDINFYYKTADRIRKINKIPNCLPEEYVFACMITHKYCASTSDLGYELLNKFDKCGCYHCLKIFDSIKVSNKWCRACCPYCDVDSIVPDNMEYPITKDLLKVLQKVMF